MKTHVLALGAGFFAACVAFAERMPIWPEGKMPDAHPHQIAAMTDEKEKGAAPYLDWCPAPAKPKQEKKPEPIHLNLDDDDDEGL